MQGFTVDLEVPYFASFRRPASTSVVLTYPVPPFTTLVGLMANALGVHWGDYEEAVQSLQEQLHLNVRPLLQERPSRELAKLLKLVGEERKERRPASFPSSPMSRYFLVRPVYRLFVASDDEGLVEQVWGALERPARPLYLGYSDDVVVVGLVWRGTVYQVASREAWALVPTFQDASGSGGELLRLPLAFSGGRDLLYSPVLVLPARFPLQLAEAQRMWQFESETVHLFSSRDACVRNG